MYSSYLKRRYRTLAQWFVYQSRNLRLVHLGRAKTARGSHRPFISCLEIYGGP